MQHQAGVQDPAYGVLTQAARQPMAAVQLMVQLQLPVGFGQQVNDLTFACGRTQYRPASSIQAAWHHDTNSGVVHVPAGTSLRSLTDTPGLAAQLPSRYLDSCQNGCQYLCHPDYASLLQVKLVAQPV